MLHCNIIVINNPVKETNKHKDMAMYNSTILKVSRAAHFITLALLIVTNYAFIASVS